MKDREIDRTMFYFVIICSFWVLYMVNMLLYDVFQEQFLRFVTLIIIFSTKDFVFNLPNGISSRRKSPVLTFVKNTYNTVRNKLLKI